MTTTIGGAFVEVLKATRLSFKLLLQLFYCASFNFNSSIIVKGTVEVPPKFFILIFFLF